MFTTISRYSYFSVALLIFLAVGVFTGASFGSQSKPTSQNDSKLEERLIHLQEQVHEQPQVDVVARFSYPVCTLVKRVTKPRKKQVKSMFLKEYSKRLRGLKNK